MDANGAFCRAGFGFGFGFGQRVETEKRERLKSEFVKIREVKSRPGT